MGNYLDNYRKRNLGATNTILEREREEMISEFDDYLNNHALTSHVVHYTKPNELPNLETNETERMAIIDVANNDKTSLDEKYLLCRNSCKVDVGSYINFMDNWYIVQFEEVKPTKTHKKFTLKKCNNIIKFGYKGEVVEIPANIVSLTLYSKGEKDYRYLTISDSKIRVFVGANEITEAMIKGYRIKTVDGFYKLTHVNKSDYTRTSKYVAGMIAWMAIETTDLPEDTDDVAYNPFADAEVTEGIFGKDFINMGEENTYTVDYKGEVEFTLDKKYSDTSIMSQGNNECIIYQDVNFDVVGDMVTLIARDKNTNKTIDIISITIRGN